MPAILLVSSGITLSGAKLLKMDGMAKCRVCGKDYTPCRAATQNGVFRWQAVSCSPECGAEYLRRIEASRAPKKPDPKPHKGKKASIPIFIDDSDEGLPGDLAE